MFIPLIEFRFCYLEQDDDNNYVVVDSYGHNDKTYKTENLANMRMEVLRKQYMKEHSEIYQPLSDGTIDKNYIHR